MKYLLKIILLLAVAYSASAQSFNVFDIDTTDFPIMKAKFLAYDADGKQRRDLSPGDFEIVEDGEVREVLSVSCPPEESLLALSSVLTIDVSGSMKGQGLINAKAAAISWINALSLGKSECAITSFNEDNYFNQDFTTDRTKLFNAIDELIADGGTDFNAGFINKMSGALLAVENGKHKKVVLFMTDGLADGDETAIVQKAKQLNTQVYSITFGEAPQILKKIALLTGGLCFENIATVNQAKNIYMEILGIVQGDQPCVIEWKSKINCKDFRKVYFTYRPIALNQSITYSVPHSMVAEVSLFPDYISFGAVEPGISKDTSITIICKNTDYSISNITVSNSDFDISPKSFTLKPGATIELTISFSPSDSGYCYCFFETESLPCGINFFVSGGFPGVAPKTRSLTLTHPNGEERFLVGSDTVITWEGLPPNEAVSLKYSSNCGDSWIKLTDSAIGLKYHWKKLPGPLSNNCLVKINYGVAVKDSVLVIQGHRGEILGVNWSPDGTKIASGCRDKSVRIWDAETGTELLVLDAHSYWGPGVMWSPDGKKIVSGDNGNTVKVWDATSGEIISEFNGHKDNISSVIWSPDGSKIASGSMDRTIRIWDALKGSEICVLVGHISGVNKLSWSPDGKKLVSSSMQSVRIWDIKDHSQIRELDKEHNQTYYCVDWSPDGTKIVAGGREIIEIWDALSGNKIHVIQGHEEYIYAVRWSPGSSKIASCGQDKIIKIWDVETEKKIYELEGHTDWIYTVSWSPDGSRLASGSRIGIIRVWNLEPYNLQSDISDTLFSIVAPEATSQNIYMGKVVTNDTKDLVITKFITNKGSWPCRIDSIYFRGADAPAFMLVGGIPQYTVAEGKDHLGEFRFMPTEAKYYEAEIVIITQADTLYQTISGDGVDPSIAAIPYILDFGIVEVMENSVLTEKLIKNVSTQNITIDSTVMLGPDYEQFHIENGGGSFTLAPNEERELTISFAPQYIGRTSGQIGFYFDQAGSPAIAQLFGKGIGGNLRMLNDSAYAGDRVTLKIVMDGIDMNKFASVIGSYDIIFSVDRTTLAPTESIFFESIRDDRTIINYSGTVENNQEYIAAIDFAVALGQYEISDTYIEEVIWYDHDGNLVEFDTEFTAGTFTLLGICREGGDRLIKPVPQAGMISISPNPAESKLNIEFTMNEPGYTEISIYNTLGEKVKTLFAEDVSIPREEIISTDIKDLASGQYLIIFKTGAFLQAEQLVILK